MLNEIDSFVRFRLIPLFSAELSLVLTESCPVLCCAGKWQFGKLKRFVRNEKENDINPVLCSGSGWKLKTQIQPSVKDRAFNSHARKKTAKAFATIATGKFSQVLHIALLYSTKLKG